MRGDESRSRLEFFDVAALLQSLALSKLEPYRIRIIHRGRDGGYVVRVIPERNAPEIVYDHKPTR